MEKTILDMCCGSRMFYFDKHDPNVLFADIREYHDTLCDGRKLDVQPDMIADCTALPFEDETFNMVVFDPPHLQKVGQNSWLCKKYGKLPENWQAFINDSIHEGMRVLKTGGTLIFKWNEQQIKVGEVLKAIKDYKPIFGHRTTINNQTIWMTFMKKQEIKKMEKTIYIPGDLVMTNGIPIGTKKGIVYQVTESNAEKIVKDGNEFTILRGSVILSNIKGNTFHDEGFLFGDCGAWIKDIVPIPLTPSILEKNGYRQVVNHSHIYQHIENDCYEIWKNVTNWTMNWRGVPLCKFKYLHELQHILLFLDLNSEMEV